MSIYIVERRDYTRRLSDPDDKGRLSIVGTFATRRAAERFAGRYMQARALKHPKSHVSSQGLDRFNSIFYYDRNNREGRQFFIGIEDHEVPDWGDEDVDSDGEEHWGKGEEYWGKDGVDEVRERMGYLYRNEEYLAKCEERAKRRPGTVLSECSSDSEIDGRTKDDEEAPQLEFVAKENADLISVNPQLGMKRKLPAVPDHTGPRRVKPRIDVGQFLQDMNATSSRE